jgi:hypothetical protein
VPTSIPKFVRPCIPTTGKLPKGPTWLHEPKWDGYRCQVIKTGKTVHIYSRNGTDWTERLPGLAESFRTLSCRSAALDGELCVTDADGRPDFRTLMSVMCSKRPDPAGLTFYAFDLLHLNGADLTGKWLIERKQRLTLSPIERAWRSRACTWSTTSTTVKRCSNGARPLGLRVSCPRAGTRATLRPSRRWVKVKCPTWRAANRETHKLFERG